MNMLGKKHKNGDRDKRTDMSCPIHLVIT